MAIMNCNMMLIIIILLAFINVTYAFGSGDIAEFSELNDKAFRHGDIENALLEIAATTAASSSLIKSFIKKTVTGKKGKNFTEKDVKRVYFGNWLRDMSQAVDVSGLKIADAKALTTVVAVLGFLSFGYATKEFEVTEERLGCYRPEEHIDNPHGYADSPDGPPCKQANYDKLRGSMKRGELDIDPETGLKNYIRNEHGDWDTSSSFIRKNLIEAIELGRRAKNGSEEDKCECFRKLGTALHTLEDFPAHSNFIEVALNSLGYQNVFTHVGENVTVRAPNGKNVSPIVTGTFGGADFFHSMLGEASDKLSSNSVGDLSTKLSQSKNSDADKIRKVLTKLLKSKDKGEKDENTDDIHPEADEKVNRLEEIRNDAKHKGNNIDPDELRNIVMEVFKIHDDITRAIEEVIEKIPFLSQLLDDASTGWQVFIYSTIEPVLSPILMKLKDVLYEASACVIDDHSQRIVFDDPEASDPTHSMLAKDHFSNILNSPAGKLAKVIITYAVQLVVKGWDNEDEDPRHLADQAIEALHHPDFSDSNHEIQSSMMCFVREWIESHGNEKDEVLRRLEKNSVLEHENTADNLSGGTTNPDDQDKYGKYGPARQGLEGVVASGVLSQVPGGDSITQGLQKLGIDGESNKENRNESSKYGRINNNDNERSSYANTSHGGNNYGHSSSGYGGDTFSHNNNDYERSSYGNTSHGGNNYGHSASGYGGNTYSHNNDTERSSYGHSSNNYGNTYGHNDDYSSRNKYGSGDNYNASGSYGHSSQNYNHSPSTHDNDYSSRNNYMSHSNTYGHSSVGGYGSNENDNYSRRHQESTYGSNYGTGNNDTYNSRHNYGSTYNNDHSSYGGHSSGGYGESAYDRNDNDRSRYGHSTYDSYGNDSYGSGHHQHKDEYGYSSGSYGGNSYNNDSDTYDSRRHESSYGSGYGSSATYGNNDTFANPGRSSNHHSSNYASSGYGGGSSGYGQSGDYGRSTNYGTSSGYGSGNYDDNDNYGRSTNHHSSNYGSSGYSNDLYGGSSSHGNRSGYGNSGYDSYDKNNNEDSYGINSYGSSGYGDRSSNHGQSSAYGRSSGYGQSSGYGGSGYY